MVWDDKVKKLKGILVLVLLMALLASPVAVLASDVTGAKYYGLIQVSNNGTAVTNVATTCNISTTNLISGGYLNSSANNCAIQSSSGADLAFMPGANVTWPWSLWVPSMGADSIKTDILYTANSTDGKLRYFPAAEGMTTTDSPSMELGDNFTVEQSGWVDTSSGDVKLLVDKPGAFRTLVSATENITSLIAGDAWVSVAPQLGGEQYTLSMVTYGGKIYGGMGSVTGELYQWNGTNAWVQAAPQLGVEIGITSLAVYDGKIYGGTATLGELYEWNGVNLWVSVAPKLGVETKIASLAVYNDKLYGGTTINGQLLEWNGANAWVLVAPKLNVETGILSLAVYNDKLYGGTDVNGMLYEWNGTNLWVEVAPKLGAETDILSLAVYNDKLYGGTSGNASLYEWNGSNAWVKVAGQLGAETGILSLEVYNEKLYGGTNPNGKLGEWNGVDAWVEVAPKLGLETQVLSMAVFDGKLYGGMGTADGSLYEWDSAYATATDVESGEHVIETKADQTLFGIGKDTVNADFPPVSDNAVLIAPLWHTELNVSPFTTKDVNEHSCTVTGATWSAAKGRWFDGGGVANDLITVPQDASINNLFDSGGTLIAWIDIASDGEANSGQIFNKDVADNGWYFTALSEAAGVVKVQFLQRYATGGQSLYWTTDDTVVSINTPTMVAVTYTATIANNAIIYVDDTTPAVTRGGTGTGARKDDSGDDLIIGNNAATTRTIDGYIMEAFAYDSILTPQEIEDFRDATKWKYETSDEYFHYNLLPTGDVPDTTANWTFLENNAMPYMEYHTVSVNGTQVQYIDWEYDTTFYDSTVFDNDATPSFRAASSDADVSAELVSFLPIAEAKAPAYVLEEAVAFIEEVPVIVSEFDVVPPAPVGGFPLAGVITAVASATDTPAQLPLVLIAGFVIIGLSLAISGIMRKYGSGTILVKVIVIAALMGVFVAFGNFGIDFWMIFVFLVMGIALAMASRQLGWQ